MAGQKLHKFNFENNRIPKITSAELNRRIKFITPCVVIKDTMPGDQCERDFVTEIKDYKLKNAFKFSYKEGERLGFLSHHAICVKDKPVNDGPAGAYYLKTICEEVGEFITIHGCGHPMLFKPSVEEVLAQLPAELFEEKKLAGCKLYFTTDILNETNFLHTSMISQQYHIAKTRVYIKE